MKKKFSILTIILLATLTFTSCKKNKEFALTSEAVEDGLLLEAFKCEQKVDSAEASIPLSWTNLPEGTGSIAIIMEHQDNGNSYLLMWGIDPGVAEIQHGAGDDGPWYMGQNKDADFISYTSPCSQGGVSDNTYVITIYALSEEPSSLPSENSMSVDLSTLKNAINTVTTVGTATLTFSA